MNTRTLLITERLTIALKAAGRLDQLSDAEIDSVIDEALPEVPEDLRTMALEFVTCSFWTNAEELALGFLAAWQPTGRAN